MDLSLIPANQQELELLRKQYQDYQNTTNTTINQLQQSLQSLQKEFRNTDRKLNDTPSDHRLFSVSAVNENDESISDTIRRTNAVGSTPFLGNTSLSKKEPAVPAHQVKDQYSRVVKLLLPSIFTGEQTSATKVKSWIKQVDDYLENVDEDASSTKSLRLARQFISGPVRLWFDAVNKRNKITGKSEMTSWNAFKPEFEKRYLPVSVEQTSLRKLLNCKYKYSIEEYNESFLQHHQLVPSLQDPVTDPITMQLYCDGITGKGPLVEHLLTAISTAIADKKAQSVLELMHITTMQEAIWKQNHSKSAYLPLSQYPQRYPNGNRNSYRSSEYRSSYSPYKRPTNDYQSQSSASTTSASTYSTPVKPQINNVNATDEMPDDDAIVRSEGSDIEQQDENDQGLAIQDDPPEPEEDQYLNLIKAYEKFKKANPKLPPEEISKRMSKGLCFRCGKEGHFAKQRSLPPDNFRKPLYPKK